MISLASEDKIAKNFPLLNGRKTSNNQGKRARKVKQKKKKQKRLTVLTHPTNQPALMRRPSSPWARTRFSSFYGFLRAHTHTRARAGTRTWAGKQNLAAMGSRKTERSVRRDLSSFRLDLFPIRKAASDRERDRERR